MVYQDLLVGKHGYCFQALFRMPCMRQKLQQHPCQCCSDFGAALLLQLTAGLKVLPPGLPVCFPLIDALTLSLFSPWTGYSCSGKSSRNCLILHPFSWTTSLWIPPVQAPRDCWFLPFTLLDGCMLGMGFLLMKTGVSYMFV